MYDWKMEREDRKDYGFLYPYVEAPKTPAPETPTPSLSPALPPVEESSVADDFRKSDGLDASEHEKQLRIWALETASKRSNPTDPHISRRGVTQLGVSETSANQRWAKETQSARGFCGMSNPLGSEPIAALAPKSVLSEAFVPLLIERIYQKSYTSTIHSDENGFRGELKIRGRNPFIVLPDSESAVRLAMHNLAEQNPPLPSKPDEPKIPVTIKEKDKNMWLQRKKEEKIFSWLSYKDDEKAPMHLPQAAPALPPPVSLVPPMPPVEESVPQGLDIRDPEPQAANGSANEDEIPTAGSEPITARPVEFEKLEPFEQFLGRVDADGYEIKLWEVWQEPGRFRADIKFAGGREISVFADSLAAVRGQANTFGMQNVTQKDLAQARENARDEEIAKPFRVSGIWKK
jgi:hypothetical protein